MHRRSLQVDQRLEQERRRLGRAGCYLESCCFCPGKSGGTSSRPARSIGQLAVLPAWKGRGLGRALHDAAIEVARRNGARTVALDTAATAKTLISLYERWGYRVVGSADWRPHTNYDSVLMLRDLNER